MTTEELRIIVKAEVDQAIAALNKTEAAEAAVSKTGGSVTSAFTKQAKEGLSVKNTLTDLAGKAGGILALGAAVEKLGEFMADSVKEYIKAEESAAKLEAIYKATGGTVGYTTGQLESMAEELQGVTGIEKDLVQNAEGVLLSFRSIKGENFKGATEAALDLSAALGMDASSAAMALGKALESPAEGLQALRRDGIILSDQTEALVKSMTAAGDAAGAQALILREVEDRYGGVAKAMGDTAGGGLKKLSNAWRDLQENIGYSIVNGIKPFVGGLTEIIEKINKIQGAEVNIDKALKTGGTSGDVQKARDDLYDKIASLRAQIAEYESAQNSGAGDMSNQISGLKEQLALYQKKRLAIEQILDTQLRSANAQAVAAAAEDAHERSWQNWFEKVTGVSQTLFTTGQQAGSLYLKGFQTSFSADKDLASALGEKFDPLPYLQKEQGEIKKVIQQLLQGIPRDQISSPFLTADASVQTLIVRVKQLDAAIASSNAAASLKSDIDSVTDPLVKLQGKMDLLNSALGGGYVSNSQYIALQTRYLTDYTDATDAAAAAQWKLGKAQEETKQVSFEDWVAQGTSAMLDQLGIVVELTDAYGALAGKIASISISGVVDSFKQLGAAFQDGKLSGDELGEALASLAKKILDELPMLFVEAGLQLIANNPAMWPIGLGLVTAGLTSAFIDGLVNSQTSSSSTTQSAKGNIFDSGSMLRFATGAAFTNSVVSRPTRFNIGEMGEKGPEAVMPLERLSDGSLGVGVTGSGSSATIVNIHNYSGQDVTTKTSRKGDQQMLEIMVGDLFDKNLSSGRHDKALMGRYTVRRQVTRG